MESFAGKETKKGKRVFPYSRFSSSSSSSPSFLFLLSHLLLHHLKRPIKVRLRLRKLYPATYQCGLPSVSAPFPFPFPPPHLAPAFFASKPDCFRVGGDEDDDDKENAKRQTPDTRHQTRGSWWKRGDIPCVCIIHIRMRTGLPPDAFR